MKSWFAKSQGSHDALDSALRRATPKVEIPVSLHGSIMQAVDRGVTCASRVSDPLSKGGDARWSFRLRLFRGIRIGWLPVSASIVAALLALGLFLHYRPGQPRLNTHSLAEISTTLTASQEIVDALPSATVGPLSQELENVNEDLDRTADFLLATLP